MEIEDWDESLNECVQSELTYLPGSGEFTGEKGSPEYEFWLFFFRLVSPSHIPEFKRRVDYEEHYPEGRISWDFWTGSKGYVAAVEKAIQVIETHGGRWKAEDWNNIQELAKNVVALRTKQLRFNSRTAGHLKVLNLWTELFKILNSGPKFQSVPEFVMTREKNSTEFDFWVFFLGVQSPQKKGEFLRIIEAIKTGVVNWSFWTEDEDEQEKSYSAALDRLLETLNDKENDPRWTPEEWRRLHGLIDKVFLERTYQYNSSGDLPPATRLEFNKLCVKWEEIREAANRPLEVKRSWTDNLSEITSWAIVKVPVILGIGVAILVFLRENMQDIGQQKQ